MSILEGAEITEYEVDNPSIAEPVVKEPIKQLNNLIKGLSL